MTTLLAYHDNPEVYELENGNLIELAKTVDQAESLFHYTLPEATMLATVELTTNTRTSQVVFTALEEGTRLGDELVKNGAGEWVKPVLNEYKFFSHQDATDPDIALHYT